jgi:hypothetical protein
MTAKFIDTIGFLLPHDTPQSLKLLLCNLRD